MRDEIRDYLGREPGRKARAASFFDGVPNIEDDLGDAIFDAHIAAAERLDPALAATSLLIVRLSGEGVIDGWVAQDMQEEILGPLAQEVEYAAPAAARDDVRLGLVGVSTGSVVLHYRPRTSARKPSAGQLAYDVHPADSAILRVSELHDLLEKEAPASTISSAFKDEQSLLRQTRKLVEALDKHAVNLSTRWWGSASDRHKSVLSQRGQAHGLRLFAATEMDEITTLNGLVTALDISGIVTVTGAANHKYPVDVGPDGMRDVAFTIGNRVSLHARKFQEVDAVGFKPSRARYTFIRHLDHPRFEL